jgi:electron transfer flavoprotein beta subunit
MKGIMQSKKKPIDTWSLADLGLDAGTAGAGAAREKALGAEKVSTTRKGEIYQGNEGAADRVIAFLVEQKVL